MQRPHESFFKRLFVIDQCVILSKNMADKNAIEKILSQDDLPIIVISQMLHKTEIKGHHVYKDVWSPEMGEELEEISRITPELTGKARGALFHVLNEEASWTPLETSWKPSSFLT